MEHLLVIDNYDSFTWNLVQLFSGFPIKTTVIRNDRVTLSEIEALAPTRILIGPGPAGPCEAGISKALVETQSGRRPILGVCLGMQCMAEVFGGKTVKAPEPVHGKVSSIRHDGSPLFSGLPIYFNVARYHSLCVDLPRESPLRITATTRDGVPMALSHTEHASVAVQFHPESYLSEYGHKLAENFLKMEGAA